MSDVSAFNMYVVLIALSVSVIGGLIAYQMMENSLPSEENCLKYNDMQIVAVHEAESHYCEWDWVNRTGWHFNKTRFWESWASTQNNVEV